MSCGMRWAEMTRASCGTPKASSMSTACFMMSQSLEEPMITPTTGAAGTDAEEVVVMAESARNAGGQRAAAGGKPGILPGVDKRVGVAGLKGVLDGRG